ncbi:MAG: hypothetical protein ACFE85_09110 [Candidatus Hodarchaeota archaeon]
MTELLYYQYNDIKLEYGSFQLPPVLIGTLFYMGESLVDRSNPEIFNEIKARRRIDHQKSLARQYNIPDLVEISANSPNAMTKYLDFYLDNYNPPFVLGGNFDARIAGVEYLSERGIKPEDYIYNTISNLKNQKEVEILKKFKIQSVVVLILGSSNMTSTQRYAYLTKKNQLDNKSIIEGLKDIGIKRIWVDGGVNDIESLAHILETQQLVSTSLKLPVGTAPSLFLFKFSSPKLNPKFHTRFRRASIMSFASWFSNFIFYGAIEDAKETFSSVYQARQFKKILKAHNIKLIESL